MRIEGKIKKKNPRWFDKNPQVTLVDKISFAAL
jgi:hypothetical protein